MQSSSLIGREGDLASLEAALSRAVAGDAATVLVGGEAGIGKTRLVTEFAARLPEGTVLVRGQCVDLDRDAPPYAPLIAALRALVATFGVDVVRESAGPGRDALAVLLPELATGEPAGSGGPDRLFDAVATALEALSRRHALIVVIEDLHWADQATLGLLRFLIRVLERAGLVLLLTYRSDELGRGHPLRPLIAELDRSRRVERLELARLSRRQVRRLSTELRGAPLDGAELDEVVQRTDGVPFFVEELLRGGLGPVESLPDTLRELLLARYELLADPTQRLLRLIAAGGVRVEHELLSAVAEVPAESLDEAAREAVQAGVLLVDETAYSFRHALVREAVHDELLPGERVRFHTRYAEALEHRAATPGADAAAVSYHWMAARDLRAAFTSSLAAMQQARQSFASAGAARLGERALELWERVPDAEQLAGRSRIELLAETAYALRDAGESERAGDLIDEAIAASSPERAEEYARLLRGKASFLANIGETGSIELLRRALDVLEGRPRSVLRANVLGELAARLMLAACFGDAVQTADAAFAEAEEVGSRPRMSVAANIRGIARVAAGDVDRGLADLELAGGLADGDDSAAIRHLINASDALSLLGRYEEAVQVAESGVEQARLRGVERTSGAMLLSNVAAPLFALGRTARADEVLDRALELDPPIGFSAHLQRLKLQSTLWSGDVQRAERLLRGWRTGLGLQRRIEVQSQLGLAAVAGEIALENGAVAEAWAEVRLLLEPGRRGFAAYDLPLAAIAARVLARARATGTALPDDPAEAERALRRVLAGASSWPTAAVHVAVAEAELGGPDGAGSEVAPWERAAEPTLHRAGAPAALRPYALLRLAEALAGEGGRAEARLRAEEARSSAAAIGLGLVVQRVSELERRMGLVRPAGRPEAGPAAGSPTRGVEDDLTDRERQVLELLARGLSNRQIAETLFISAKTASVHVSNILRKTNTSTRTEAAFLARSFAGRRAI